MFLMKKNRKCSFSSRINEGKVIDGAVAEWVGVLAPSLKVGGSNPISVVPHVRPATAGRGAPCRIISVGKSKKTHLAI